MPVEMLRGKIQGAGQDVNENHCRQEKCFGGGGQVNQILSAAIVSFIILMVGNQRIGADRDNLIEKIHGEKIVGKGHADGPEDGQGETGIKPSLCVFFESAHVAHRIKNGDRPERRGDEGEDHRHGIGTQRHGYSRQDGKHMKHQGLAMPNRRHHRADNQQQQDRGNGRDRLPDVLFIPLDHHPECTDEWNEQS